MAYPATLMYTAVMSARLAQPSDIPTARDADPPTAETESPKSAVPPSGVPDFGGETGTVAFEYALVTTVVGIPLLSVVLYVWRVLLDLYEAQATILSLPWP
jgi:hypothetical protein